MDFRSDIIRGSGTNNAGLFTYKSNRYAAVTPQAVTIFALLGLRIWVGVHRHEGLQIGDLWMVLLVGAMVWFAIVQQVSTCDISIDEAGITGSVFGYTWKVIPWQKVRSVAISGIIVRTGLFTSKIRPVYSVYDIEKPRRFHMRDAGIIFDEEIQGFQELLNLVQVYARRHDIPVVDNRK